MSQEEDEISLACDGNNYDGFIGNPDNLGDDAESLKVSGVGGNEIFHKSSDYMVPS